jgi:hypothetical protein
MEQSKSAESERDTIVASETASTTHFTFWSPIDVRCDRSRLRLILLGIMSGARFKPR